MARRRVTVHRPDTPVPGNGPTTSRCFCRRSHKSNGRRSSPRSSTPNLRPTCQKPKSAPSTYAADSRTLLHMWTSPYNLLASVGFNTHETPSIRHSSGGLRSSPPLSSANHQRSCTSSPTCHANQKGVPNARATVLSVFPLHLNSHRRY